MMPIPPPPFAWRAGTPRVVGQDGRYLLEVAIGRGSFGSIYRGRSRVTDRPVAIKLEPLGCDYPQLVNETKALRWLNHRLPPGIVPTIYAGGEQDGSVFLVMELLGCNMSKLMDRVGGRFSLSTTLHIGVQLLTSLEQIHDATIVHRDLKPENIVLASNAPGETRLMIIDWGLFKQVVNPSTGAHIPREINHPFLGTPRYASVACHAGEQLSRRDDVESLMYVLLYCLKGRLPWQLERPNMTRAETHAMTETVGRMKQELGPQGLCDRMGVPTLFADLIAYAQSLRFSERPNYEALRDLMRRGMDDAPLDWVAP